MTKQVTMRKWIFLVVAMLIAASAIGAGVVSQKRQQSKKQWPEEPRVTSMPPVLSKIKELEVVRAWIEDPGTPAARVAVEIRNNSRKDVMAVDLVCGEGSITRNGLTDEENPIVVMKPNATTTIRMGFGEMTFGAPLVVSAVTYADRTEEGDESSLKRMHRTRDHDKAQLKAEKELKRQKEVPTP